MENKKPQKGWSDFVIDKFPAGNDNWRVDWFGGIDFPNRDLRTTHPSVCVHLSKVVAPDFLTNPQSQLAVQSTLPVDQQVKRWVAVGTLVKLRIGDIWSNKQCVGTPDYTLETFEDVQIDQATSQLVAAGSPNELGDYLLPFREHPWHHGNTHSWCLRVQLASGQNLMVPCMELIRFYFGSSSRLLDRLIVHQAGPRFYTRRFYPQERGKEMFVELADELPRASAADVARIAGSNTAQRAAHLISRSLVRAAVAREDLMYPQAVFPFEGKTTLVASGKWLSWGGRPRHTFLVYNLRSCSHPFPFTELRYKAGSATSRFKKEPTSPSDAPAGDAASAGSSASRTKAPKNPKLVEQDPSSALAPATIQITSNRHFPDLVGKPLFGSRALKTATEKAAGDGTFGSAGTNEPVEDLALGEGGSSRRARPVSLVEALSETSRKSPPPFLQRFVKALSGLVGFDVSLESDSHEDGWTLAAPLACHPDGEIAHCVLITEGQQQRMRRVGVFLLAKDIRSAQLWVAESKPTMAMLYPVASGSDEEAAEIMRKADVDVLKVMMSNKWSDSAFRSGRESEPGAFAAWLLDAWSTLAEKTTSN